MFSTLRAWAALSATENADRGVGQAGAGQPESKQR